MTGGRSRISGPLSRQWTSLNWIAGDSRGWTPAGLAHTCPASGRYSDSGGGWILNLGVLREARGRGVGRYLLEHALAAYAADGRTWAGLGVDTENVSGALRLYESVGMTPALQIDAYERRVAAGRVN